MNPIYDIDMTGLSKLFEGVVAYVEVRSGFEDISNEISREMKELGAVISDKRNSKVTHVIFREGTLRTSDWAKKHRIPLVGVGWLAASARNRMRFICTPWRQEYLEQQIDVCGFKKKMRYKKYCKAMNLEEFEAELNKSTEKIKKKFNKSLNKSKSSTASEDPEYERVMKLTDPYLRPRPPTPEFIKRHLKRHERIRQGGRYSWESSDEEKGQSSDDTDDGKSIFNQINKESDNVLETSNSENIPLSGHSRDLVPVKQRLLKEGQIDDYLPLVNPVSAKKSRKLKQFFPKAVQQVVGVSSNRDKKRKRTSFEDTEPPSKINRKSSSLVTLLNKSPPLNNSSKKDAPDQALRNTPLIKHNISKKLPLSPLIINDQSATCISKENCMTPLKKRKSLRTKVLLNSTKKHYQDVIHSELDSSSNNSISKLILVPDTVIKKKSVVVDPTLNLSSDIPSVPETPLLLQNAISSHDNYLNLSNNTIHSESVSESISDSGQEHSQYLPDSFYKSPMKKNVRKSSQPLTNIDLNNKYNNVQEDVYSSLQDNDLSSMFIPKRNVRRSTRLFQDVEKVQSANVSSSSSSSSKENNFLPKSLPKQTIPLLSELSKISEEIIEDTSGIKKSEVTMAKKNNRRVTQILSPLSNSVKSTQETNPGENINTIKEKEPTNILGFVRTQPRETQYKRNLKRHWSAVEPEKKEKLVKSMLKKSPIKIKKIRDSSDDFIFTTGAVKNKKIASKSLLNPVSNELVFVGLDDEELLIVKKCCSRLPHDYHCADIIHMKEQLVVVPDKPKRSLELTKAFIFGNTFISMNWFRECIAAKTWLNWSPFVITYSDVIQSPLLKDVNMASSQNLFKDYTAMYIFPNKKSILPKYKLQLVIEQCGGTVTDSFRQAGVVIDTRKVNAFSVSSAWILDCIKNGSIVDHSKYIIF